MLTFRLGMFQLDEKRVEELVAAIKRTPGSCDTVWLTTMGYYPSLEKHIEYAEAWKKPARIFREAGIRVSMQIANTFGHVDVPMASPENGGEFAKGMMNTEDDPFMVGPSGVKNKSCFCWNSISFRDYFKSVVRIYCERLHPQRLWFDDDLRADNHYPNLVGCFCDRCVSKFNEQQECNFSRDALVHEINYGDTEWRKKYIDFCRQGIYEFTYDVACAAASVTEGLTFGLEYGHDTNLMGTDDTFILQALYDASGQAVETRPGAGFYDDKSPWEQYIKGMYLAMANSTLPDYVQAMIAEIEDLPGTAYGKSIGGIINEGTIDLAMGCTGLSFTDIQSCHETMDYYQKIFSRLSDIRSYWERLSAISQKNYRGGVNIYIGEQPHLRKLTDCEDQFSWAYCLTEHSINWLRRGLPITYDRHKPAAYLLHHSSIASMTDNDIRFLLTQPVVTDGEAINQLFNRGYGEHFALTPVSAGYDTMEIFTESSINRGKIGLFYEENPYASVPMQRYIFRDLDNRSEVVGDMYNGHFLTDEALVGPCTIITEIVNKNNEFTVKWFVSGYSMWNDRASSAKRNQIVNALDAIATMPAKLINEEQAVIIPSVDENGKTVSVTIAAASQNGTGPLKVLVRHPVGLNADAMATRHNTIPVSVSLCRQDEICLTTGPLDPYEVMTVFIN